jgi:hypothetical protein
VERLEDCPFCVALFAACCKRREAREVVNCGGDEVIGREALR